MIRLAACIAALIILGGCTSLRDNLCYRIDSRLADVAEQLEKGNETSATKQLEDISNRKDPEDGVTDEALFRLSLLELRKYDDSKAMHTLQKRLLKLQTGYPTSQWSKMSWPLTEYVTQMESIRSELRNIKQKYNSLSKDNKELTLSNQQLQGAVQSLTKENREINQRIEKLKSLDLELEKKNRR